MYNLLIIVFVVAVCMALWMLQIISAVEHDGSINETKYIKNGAESVEMPSAEDVDNAVTTHLPILKSSE